MCRTVKGCYGYADVGGYMCEKKEGHSNRKKRGKDHVSEHTFTQIVRDKCQPTRVVLIFLLIAFDIFHFNQEKLNNILPCHQIRLFPCLSRLS